LKLGIVGLDQPVQTLEGFKSREDNQLKEKSLDDFQPQSSSQLHTDPARSLEGFKLGIVGLDQPLEYPKKDIDFAKDKDVALTKDEDVDWSIQRDPRNLMKPVLAEIKQNSDRNDYFGLKPVQAPRDGLSDAVKAAFLADQKTSHELADQNASHELADQNASHERDHKESWENRHITPEVRHKKDEFEEKEKLDRDHQDQKTSHEKRDPKDSWEKAKEVVKHITPGVGHKDKFEEKEKLDRDQHQDQKTSHARDPNDSWEANKHITPDGHKDEFAAKEKLDRDQDQMPGAGVTQDMPTTSEGGFADKAKAVLKAKNISVKKEKAQEKGFLWRDALQKRPETLEMPTQQIQQILSHKDKDWVAPFELGIESAPIAFDILDFEDKVLLRGDFPGFDKKKFELTLDGNTLLIKGVRELDEPESVILRKERAFGTVYRRFMLPDIINENSLWGKFETGVLTIFCPKEKRAKGERAIGKTGPIRID